MGGSQSRTRKLTVENDDPTSVIKVSDDVVQRIRNSQDARSTPEQPVPSAAQAVTVPLPYLYEPSLTTVQLRQSNVEQLKKNDQYWETRLKNLQSKHKRINDIMDFEYKNAVEELEGKNKKKPFSEYNPPCQDNKEAVLNCYKQYPNKPMRCAQIVEDFQRCVDSKRDCVVNRG